MNSRRSVLRAKVSDARPLIFKKTRDDEAFVEAQKLNYRVKLPVQKILLHVMIK